LLLVWTTAATGITLRSVFPNSLPSVAAIGIFLLMGWGGLIAFHLLWKRYGYSFVRPLLWGGVAYTVGVIILELNWPKPMPGVIGSHELWHLAVLIGLSLHWKFVFSFAGGMPDETTKITTEVKQSPPQET
jgi:hemolysin III